MNKNDIKLIGVNIFSPSLYDEYENQCRSWIEDNFIVLDWEYKYNSDGFIQCRIHLDDRIHIVFSESPNAVIRGIKDLDQGILVESVGYSVILDEYTDRMTVLVMSDPMSDDMYDEYDSLGIDKFVSIINDHRVIIDKWKSTTNSSKGERFSDFRVI